MTVMDKKINELSRKTGVDFKKSAKEVYANKPLFIGLVSGASLFVFTGAGLILSAAVGIGIGVGVNALGKILNVLPKF